MSTDTPPDNTQSQPEQPVYIPYTPQNLGTEPEQGINPPPGAATANGQPNGETVAVSSSSEPVAPTAPPPLETVQKPASPTTILPKIPSIRINIQGIRIEVEKFTPFILAILAIATGIGIFAAIQILQPDEAPVMPVTIVITPTPTPTPIRTATNISTTSAFLTFVEDITTLQSNIRDFEKDDPMLSPPSLVLPLGF